MYGLAPEITDGDSCFTLGDIGAKLKRVRETIDADGIPDKNRSLPTPADFFRVGVILNERFVAVCQVQNAGSIRHDFVRFVPRG